MKSRAAQPEKPGAISFVSKKAKPDNQHSLEQLDIQVLTGAAGRLPERRQPAEGSGSG
jgi:hypothetical protein